MAQSPFNDREFARQAGIKSGVLRRERAQRRADAAESVSAVIAALAAEPHKHETISVSVSPDGMISVSATPAERRERQAEDAASAAERDAGELPELPQRHGWPAAS